MAKRKLCVFAAAIAIGAAGVALGMLLQTDPGTAAPAAPLIVAQTRAASPAAGAAVQAAPRGGPREGIKVHGHWTIVVKNPDGTVAQRREFENALVTTGGYLLARILAGRITPGPWLITLPGACGTDSCRIYPPALVVDVTGGNQLVLSGA